MDAVVYAHSAKQAKRIKRFIENPDSNSGVLTQPKVIEAGETVTIKSGRQAILADTVVNGDLVIEAGGGVFVPAGAGFIDLEGQIALKAPLESPTLTGNPTLNGEALVKLSSDGLRIEKSDNTSIKNQCTAWVIFDNTTTPVTILDSFKVASVVRTATGLNDIYFEEEMDIRAYSANISYFNNISFVNSGVSVINTSKTKLSTNCVAEGVSINSPYVSVQIFGGRN